MTTDDRKPACRFCGATDEVKGSVCDACEVSPPAAPAESAGEYDDRHTLRAQVDSAPPEPARDGLCQEFGIESRPDSTPQRRPNRLKWNGNEWVDYRCGCRYHPDDDSGTHGGGPHVHPCEAHRKPAPPQGERPPAKDRTREGYLQRVRVRLSLHGRNAHIGDVANAYDEGFRRGRALDDLVRRAVTRPPAPVRPRVRWALVGDVFALGSGSARELCRRFGCDPDEILGFEEEDDDVDE